MTAALAHRGPDQLGCRVAPEASLGAVRLKVIDLEGGSQPFVSEDGATALVFNGEIYNHRQLRQDLKNLGHTFRTACDTEVVLKAFLQWDVDCFPRLRGMFALALWMDRPRRLVLCRDRMGIKPLYIRRAGSDIVFGSELKALFAHPAVTRRLDLAALQDFLSLNYVPAPKTLVEGIEKLPSGHYLDWRNGESTLNRWWNPDWIPDSTVTEDYAVIELDRLLRKSVREHLASDVPVGLWASGGVDSTTLLHYAAEESAEPVRTFSVAFRSKADDESAWFRQIARHYGTVHQDVELDGGPAVADAIQEMASFSDEPGADAGALPVWFLSKLSRESVTVALSGEGGDELFGGYLTYRADHLARPLRLIPRSLRRAALGSARSLLPVRNNRVGFEFKVKRFLEGSLLHPDEAHLFWNGSFSREQKLALVRSNTESAPERLFGDLPDARSVGHLNRYLMLDQRYYLQDNLLYKVDRMSMAHSLEVRPPFLDHRLVEFAARLPQHLKIRGSQLKYLLKKTMRGRIPECIIARPKAGLDIPAHEWFRGSLLPLLRDTLDAAADSGARYLFHMDRVQSLLDSHLAHRTNSGYQLWGLLTLFLWMKRWDIEVDVPAEYELAGQTDLAAAS
jgi:asparagine synthase (glutamine-hydrolysing)